MQAKIYMMNEFNCFITMSALFLCINSCKEMNGTDFYIEKSITLNQNCELRAVLPTCHNRMNKDFAPRGVIIFDLFGECDTVDAYQYLLCLDELFTNERLLVEQLKPGGELTFTFKARYGMEFVEKLKQLILHMKKIKTNSISIKDVVYILEKEEIDVNFKIN